MSDADTERTVVKTYVPSYQKEAWIEDAEAMDMSQSEFVRTMVQAGRAEFGLDDQAAAVAGGTTEGTASDSDDGTTDPGDGETASTDAAAPGAAMEERVAALLAEETMSWEELLDALTADVEARLETALESLQADNVVMYSGRNGGYQVIDE